MLVISIGNSMINICSDIWHNNIITYNKIKYIYMQLFTSENFRRKIEFICAYLQGKQGFFPKLHVPHTKTLCKAKMQIWSSIHCCSEGIFPYYRVTRLRDQSDNASTFRSLSIRKIKWKYRNIRDFSLLGGKRISPSPSDDRHVTLKHKKKIVR